MKKWNQLGWIAVAAVAVAGCGKGSDAPAPDSSTAGKPAEAGTTSVKKKDIKIVMIAKSSNNPVFLASKVGAEAAAKELGDKNGIKITIDWRTPNEEDGTVQAQRIAQGVNEGADAILLSCSDAAKVTGAIDDAVAKGVPVMTFDSDAPKSKRFAFYGADDEAVGKQLMDEVVKVTGGKAMVAILAGNQNAPNLQRRSQAVVEAAKANPGIKIIGTFNHKESPQDASAEVTKDMNAHPEITCWAMVGGWPLFNTSLLSSLDATKVKIVAVDALPAQLPYIDKGLAPVLLAQPVYDWGYKSVGFIVDKIVLGKDVPAINKMDLVRVSKDNLGDWAHQLKEWGFTDVDPKFLALSTKK